MNERRVQETVLTAEGLAGRVFPQPFEEFAANNPGAFRGKALDMSPETPNRNMLFFTETTTATTAEFLVLGAGYTEPQCAIRFEKNSPEVRFWCPKDQPYRDSDVLFVMGRIDGTEANEEQIAKWAHAINKVLDRQESQVE